VAQKQTALGLQHVSGGFPEIEMSNDGFLCVNEISIWIS